MSSPGSTLYEIVTGDGDDRSDLEKAVGSVATLRARIAELEKDLAQVNALLDAPPYVDCICPGCPRKVPHAWAAGMCGPCADEDCDHTDGARAVAAELAEVTAERDRLRAVMNSTDENVELVAQVLLAQFCASGEEPEPAPPWQDVIDEGSADGYRADARAVLVAIRRKAMEEG